jgi:hypothetical protein
MSSASTRDAGAPESWSLEQQAAARDGLAASLLSLSIRGFTESALQST